MEIVDCVLLYNLLKVAQLSTSILAVNGMGGARANLSTMTIWLQAGTIIVYCSLCGWRGPWAMEMEKIHDRCSHRRTDEIVIVSGQEHSLRIHASCRHADGLFTDI